MGSFPEGLDSRSPEGLDSIALRLDHAHFLSRFIGSWGCVRWAVKKRVLSEGANVQSACFLKGRMCDQ